MGKYGESIEMIFRQIALLCPEITIPEYFFRLAKFPLAVEHQAQVGQRLGYPEPLPVAALQTQGQRLPRCGLGFF